MHRKGELILILTERNQYLRSIEVKKNEISNPEEYPFYLPVLKDLTSLDFHPKVTYFVGENGSGKSTILEALAVAYGFNPEGGTINFNFSSRDTHSELYKYIKLIKGVRKPKDGFFLRAESFYNLATNIDELDMESYEYVSPSRIVDSYGGKSLHKQSHGESFFSLFLNRFGGNGLYILDEPEAALSPSRQMSMLSRIHELVEEKSQFIIATHSPIIMAYPDSTIYEIKNSIKSVKYEKTENYQLMKRFLNKTEDMLDILLKE